MCSKRQCKKNKQPYLALATHSSTATESESSTAVVGDGGMTMTGGISVVLVTAAAKYI